LLQYQSDWKQRRKINLHRHRREPAAREITVCHVFFAANPGCAVFSAGVGACEICWDGDSQVLSQCLSDHGVTCTQLVAETDDFNLAVPVDGCANALHGVGEINKPGIGTSTLQNRCWRITW